MTDTLKSKIKSDTLINSDNRSVFIDKIIKKSFKILGAPAGLALIATGGYGRQDMTPYSDSDLLVLSEGSLSVRGKGFIDRLIKELWSQNIKPSVLLRDLASCKTSMETDLNFLTSLIDMRHVAGDRAVTRALADQLHAFKATHPPGKFVSEKLAERDLRHARLGDNRYWLEPNVKDGKGALRDLQTLMWIAGYLFEAHTADALFRKKLLTREEAASLQKAQIFFMSTRHAMHARAKRAEDRLSFDMQPDVALQMGYIDPSPTVRAEAFMKDYFLMTAETGHLTRAICAELETQALSGGATAATRKMAAEGTVEGFPLLHNRLNFKDGLDFKSSPAAIAAIFRASQHSGFDIHPDALRAIRAAIKKNPSLIALNAAAGGILLDIITYKKEAETTLRRMNEAGVLVALLPDFDNIRAHMQFDMYHAFTADEHTLRACGMMHRLENGDFAAQAPLATGLWQKGIRQRDALYAAMFLHDIAKGTGNDHSRKGGEIATALCPVLGLDAQATDTVRWLVENHLLMTMTAFKRDLSDAQTIAIFAAQVQSAERLALLLILSVADIMAVGPDRWNNWKAVLLRELYHKTYAFLSGAGDEIDAAAMRDKHLESQHQDNHAPRAGLDYLSKAAPAVFWQNMDSAEIAAIARGLEKRTGHAIIIKTNDERDYTDVVVHTPDRRGLFALLSGAMAAAGASIVDARIFTLHDSTALDIFRIQSIKGGVYENAGFLKKTITQALSGQIDLDAEIRDRLRQRSSRQKLFARASRCVIDNNASRHATMIEIGAHDRPGLLYAITSTLTALDLQIVAAKVTTFGNRAADTFYVRDAFGLKILHPQRLAAIEAALFKTLEQTKE